MSLKDNLVYDFFYVDQKLPPYTHTVTEAEIDAYCSAIRTETPVYLDHSAACKAGFKGKIAPPMMVIRYAHFQNVLTGFNGTIPGHSIHVSGDYEFGTPVKPDDVITTTGRVIDKFIKKGKKFISFELISVNQDGQLVVRNRHTSLWPK
jgi:acyl dehydratase